MHDLSDDGGFECRNKIPAAEKRSGSQLSSSYAGQDADEDRYSMVFGLCGPSWHSEKGDRPKLMQILCCKSDIYGSCVGSAVQAREN